MRRIYCYPNRPSQRLVLELSTRACKLVIANLEKLTGGLWSAFENDANDTGHLLDQNNYLHWDLFEEKSHQQ